MIDVYFTVQEANLFMFYRIPKELFTNPKYKKLSAEAKILYGLLLDRNSLSIKNGWVDERGYIYIFFSRDEVMEMLGISNKKAVELFKELRETDLIEEVRQGLNKPNIIFVKKFIQTPETIENTRTCKNYTSRRVKITRPDVKKLHANNTYLNETYEKKEKSVSQSPVIDTREGEETQGEETDGQTDELHTLFSQAQIEIFESEELRENIKETITQAYSKPETQAIIKRVRLEHLDIALAKFREANEEKTIKNPKQYFAKCLISAIAEYGLKAFAWE